MGKDLLSLQNTNAVPIISQHEHTGMFVQKRLTQVLVTLLLLLLSHFSHVRLCAAPESAAHQDLPSLRFSRQEHWSGLPFPSPVHESEK